MLQSRTATIIGYYYSIKQYLNKFETPYKFDIDEIVRVNLSVYEVIFTIEESHVIINYIMSNTDKFTDNLAYLFNNTETEYIATDIVLSEEGDVLFISFLVSPLKYLEVTEDEVLEILLEAVKFLP